MPETITQKCELTDVFRQKGGSPIIENSMRINRGETTLETRDDFQILHTKSEEESRDKVLEIMKGLYNPDDPFETQILCPSRKGEAGITNLNTLLQQEFNPGKKGLQYGSTKKKETEPCLVSFFFLINDHNHFVVGNNLKNAFPIISSFFTTPTISYRLSSL